MGARPSGFERTNFQEGESSRNRIYIDLSLTIVIYCDPFPISNTSRWHVFFFFFFVFFFFPPPKPDSLHEPNETPRFVYFRTHGSFPGGRHIRWKRCRSWHCRKEGIVRVGIGRSVCSRKSLARSSRSRVMDLKMGIAALARMRFKSMPQLQISLSPLCCCSMAWQVRQNCGV